MTAQLTDDQLRIALNQAAEDDSIEISGAWGCTEWCGYELDGLRRILAALPGDEAQDEWQIAPAGDFKAGDRLAYETDGVRVELHDPLIEDVSIEHDLGGVVAHFKGKEVEVDVPVCDATFYRIPAPVVAPDPAEHKYIAITELKTGARFSSAKAAHADQWGYNSYIVAGWGRVPAEDITGWEPLAVAGE